MRIKTFLIACGCVLITSYILIIITSNDQQNDSINKLMSQTKIHINAFQKKLTPTARKKLDIDAKYLSILGFTHNNTNIHDHHHRPHRTNFSVVSYVLNGQASSAISLIQNLAVKLPNDTLYLYDLGLSDVDSHALTTYCNTSKCTVIAYDLTRFPPHITDERMHAFRPLLIKDALMRSSSILFIENNVRINQFVPEFRSKIMHAINESGVHGWTTRQAVSSRTHPRMFPYFQTNEEDFMFLPMVSMETVLFVDTELINEKILLPWIKCSLTLECIHPIGAQSGGCRYNKKPLYRYSGCHAYDASAFNIVLGLTWNFDETKYSSRDNADFYHIETHEQATKFVESSKRKNTSDTSDHPYSDD